MSIEEQLERWVAGDPVHNDERDECCPDFSCCTSELLAAEEERVKFREATGDARDGMLATFLGRALVVAGEAEVYVSGDPANYRPLQ